MDEDSDEDEDRDPEILDKLEEPDVKFDKTKLAPEDTQFPGELADGVNRIRVRLSFLPICASSLH